MNVLFAVHQFFPHHYTGTERVVLDLAKAFLKRGYRPLVLTYAIDGGDGLQAAGDYLIGRYDYEGIRVVAVRHRHLPLDIDYFITDPGLERFLEQLLDDEDIDLVHVCHPMRVGSIIPAAHRRKIPVILTLTDFWLLCPRFILVTLKGDLCYGPDGGKKCARECFPGSWREYLKQRKDETEQLKQCVSRIIAPTRFLTTIFRANGYKKISIIPFGLDYRGVRFIEKTYTATDTITLGYLSTPVYHKGGHILIQAFLCSGMPNVKVAMYGDNHADPSYYESLRSLADGNPGIHFHGRYSHDQLTRIFQDIDLVVVPSLWWENAPLVLLMSLAHGVPAVVSDLGGLTELVTDGVNGFSFQAGNVQELAETIRKIGSDPTLLNDLRRNIRPPLRIEEEMFFYDQVYQEVLKEQERSFIAKIFQ